MRKICLITFLTVAWMFLAGNAEARPTYNTICSECHGVDAGVSVSATSLGCSGGQETFQVSVSDTYDAGEGWAAFSGGSNLYNGAGTSGTFTASGGTYEVWGVSDSDMGIGGGKGGSNSVSITVDCSGTTCTDADGDGYFAESGCGTEVDCNDSDPAINPGAIEDCTDGIDNDCDGLVDGEGLNANVCPTCTDADGDGYNAEGGSCGPKDCNDLAFGINPGATEICDNGIDDDCDGYLDSLDPDCGACIPTARNEKGPRGSDGIDNDCDGLIDSDDPDVKPGGRGNGSPEVCDDGIDNDGDGKIDCSDKKDCGKDPVCG